MKKKGEKPPKQPKVFTIGNINCVMVYTVNRIWTLQPKQQENFLLNKMIQVWSKIRSWRNSGCPPKKSLHDTIIWENLFCEGETIPYANINRVLSSGQTSFFSSTLAVSRTNTSEFLLLSWACMVLQKPVTSVCIPNILKSWNFGLFLLYRLWHIPCGTYCPALDSFFPPPQPVCFWVWLNGWKKAIKSPTLYVDVCQDTIEKC